MTAPTRASAQEALQRQQQEIDRWNAPHLEAIAAAAADPAVVAAFDLIGRHAAELVGAPGTTAARIGQLGQTLARSVAGLAKAAAQSGA